MSNIYYGWRVVASLFVILTFSAGFGFYNHAVMLQSLVAERDLSVTLASTAVSVFFLSSGVAGLVIATAIEKYDVRIVISIGALMAAGALMTLSFVQQDWQLLLLYGIFGVGFAASGLLPATTLVTRWFERKRAMALSITSTGLSVGGILITPASALLIESTGIDQALLVFAGLYLLGTIPICWWGLRSDPADLGMEIDGAILKPGKPILPSGMHFRDVMSERYFWGLSFAYIFLMMAQVGGIAHQYGLVAEFLSGTDAAMALAVIPIASTVGRLAGGFILESVSLRRFAQFVMILQSVSLTTLALSTSVPVFLFSLVLFGVTIGNLLMLQPLLIAETYGRRHYSRIYSISNMLSTLGVAAGPFVLGYIYSQLGTYAQAYLAAGLAGVIGWLVFYAFKPKALKPKTLKLET